MFSKYVGVSPDHQDADLTCVRLHILEENLT